MDVIVEALRVELAAVFLFERDCGKPDQGVSPAKGPALLREHGPSTQKPLPSKIYNYMDVIVEALRDELAAFFEGRGF